ncbi:MAG: hypothetical protein IPN94_24080 [Sphingobacteriales bacterium]|nr:hypothetical protein [Sphingobacteriales bacterium]
MYERKHEPLLQKQAFVRRLGYNILVAFEALLVSLGLGIIGYHNLCHFSWIDSLLNASMILGGMGPVSPIDDEYISGKVFASFYAIFSGIGFVGGISILLAPILHRIYHRFHIEDELEKETNRKKQRH